MLTSLQFLRGFAALMVVLIHSAAVVRDQAGYVFSSTVIGASAADIFFVISGFIMVYITHERPATPWNFLARRLIRIAPLYWFYTTISIALLLIVPNWFRQLRFDLSHTIYSYLFLLSPNNTGTLGTVLGVGWTVAYEAYFYFLFGLCLFLPKNLPLPALSTVIVLGAILEHYVTVPVFALVAFNAVPLEFLAGCLLAVLYLRGHYLSGALSLAAIALGIVWILWFGIANAVTFFWEPLRVIYFGVPATLIVAGALSLEVRGLVRFPRLIILIGDSSYSLYLSHAFVLITIGLFWKALGLRDVLPAEVLYYGATAVAVCIGIFLYRFSEKPLTDWLNHSFAQYEKREAHERAGVHRRVYRSRTDGV